MITAVIQARFHSDTLPGKVLRNLNGHPALWYTLESVKQVKNNPRIILATSKEAEDDPIAEFGNANAVEVYRGDLNDVTSRYHDIARFTGSEALIRICGNHPLIDHRLINRAIKDFLRLEPDLVTNMHPPTYPGGMSVDVIKSSTLINNYTFMSDPKDLEEVTPFFHRNASKLNVINFTFSVNAGGLNFSADTEDDFTRIESILKKMANPHWSYNLDDLLRMQ